MGTCGNVELYLIRHGITQWNHEKKYLGWTDQVLLESETTHLDVLKNTIETVSFDDCYSSDLRRCQETLSYILPNSRVILDQRLRELNFGDWEGKTYETLKDDERYQQWVVNWESLSPPKGESGQTFQARLQSFLTDLTASWEKKKRRKVLIVTHGGVIRSIVSLYVLFLYM
jgi:alpha-ribazole phosphatase